MFPIGQRTAVGAIMQMNQIVVQEKKNVGAQFIAPLHRLPDECVKVYYRAHRQFIVPNSPLISTHGPHEHSDQYCKAQHSLSLRQ